MSRLGRIAARAGLALGALGVAALAVELALTVAHRSVEGRDPYELVAEWNSPFVFRVRGEVAGNALGLRRHGEIRAEKGSGVLPVLSYGDSIAGGYGVEDAQMYAHRLESALNARGERAVEVLSMARGHSPTVYGFHLRSDLPRLHPDGVLVQIELLNDVSDEARVHTTGVDADGLATSIQSHRYILGLDGHVLAPLAFSGSLVERTILYAKLSRWYGRVREKLEPNPLFAPDSSVLF